MAQTRQQLEEEYQRGLITESEFNSALLLLTPEGEDRNFYFTNNRTPEIRVIKQSDMLKCPFAIMAPEHYRDDGTCKCDDAEHRKMMMRDWEYTKRDFIKAGIIKP